MKREELQELENTLQSMLKQVQFFKDSPTIENAEYAEIDSIEAFIYHMNQLTFFMASIRPKGWLGESPQRREDLVKAHQYLQNLHETKSFIKEMYEKNKDYIKRFDNR